MYAENNGEPGTDDSGTAHCTTISSENIISYRSFCILFSRHEAINFRLLNHIPVSSNFAIQISWSKLSKDFIINRNFKATFKAEKTIVNKSLSKNVTNQRK